MLSFLVAGAYGANQTKSCSCMPKSMVFQLNATAGCTQDLTKGSDTGISDSFCLIREAKVVSDLVPVSVNTVKIFELGEDLTTVGSPTVVKSVSDGDLIDFSFSNSTNSIGGIQLMIKGVNKNGTTVTQDSIVAFTNGCNALVFTAGDEIGFLTIAAVTQPSQTSCPASTQNSSSVSLSDSYQKESSGNDSVSLSDSYVSHKKWTDDWYGSYSISYSYSHSYSYSYSHSYPVKPKSKKSPPKKVEKITVKRVGAKKVTAKKSSMSYPQKSSTPKVSGSKESTGSSNGISW